MLYLIRTPDGKKLKKKIPWEPRCKKPKKELIDKSELGLPAIQSVNKTSSLPKELAWGHMQEGKSMISKTIGKKLDKALEPLSVNTKCDNDVKVALEEMMRIVSSPARFDNKTQFSKYLTEGTILNINKLVSQSIGIPQGEYVLYRINMQKAVLIPTAEVTVQETNYNSAPKSYEVYTNKLLGCWNKMEGTILEDDTSENNTKDDTTNNNKSNLPPRRYSRKEIEQTSHSKYKSVPEVVSALERAGKTQEEVADEIGVHPSTVSRYKHATSTKGGRVPSLGAALKLADATGGNIEAMFGNIEAPVKRKATSGSGGGRNEVYRQGAIEQ